MATCVGIEGKNPIVYQQNGNYVHTTMSSWIDGLFSNDSANVKNVDSAGAVQQLDLNDPSFKIWCTDQVGLPQEKQVLRVQRTDLRRLPADSYRILRFLTQNGTSVVFGSDTPLVTRVNNEIGQIPANQWTTDDARFMIACNLWGYVLRTSGPELVQYAVQPYMPVPEVITATWGVMNITRGDASSLIEMCDNYPESVDPGDRAVFDSVLTEMVQYDPIQEIRDETGTFSDRYLYWIETEWGNFASFMNSFLTGVPHISALYNPPLNQTKMDEAKNKGAADAKTVLKSFRKPESKTE